MPPAAERAHEDEGVETDEGDHGEDREIAPRPVDTRALAPPEDTETPEPGADREAERPNRGGLEGRAESGDDRREHEARGADAEEGRAPAADDPDGEHDRQCLHRLDGAGEKRCQEEKDVVCHWDWWCRRRR